MANTIYQSEYDDKYYFKTQIWGSFGPYDTYGEAEEGYAKHRELLWDMESMARGAKIVNPRSHRITKRW